MRAVVARFVGAFIVLAVVCLAASQTEKPASSTGPVTELRFPKLKVPPGFAATLFACDPLIEYPSVIAAGPRPGSLFVAFDYMTGLGTDIVRRDEVRLVEDTDNDGYADKATLFADRFNSIQGLAYQDGTLFVMHSPYLTALRNPDKDGKAKERRDLLTGLGLPPEQDQIRLHNANGVVVGHDGWLYLALGDRGCDVKRPEGDRLLLNSGGILRCRPDGSDLHVFSMGLRNIYDVALDADLNVFVRDNENDGGTYMIRVCHSFHGADHGYPYLYDKRPDEALPPLADLGLGSSAGVTCYLESQFPAEFRGNLFSCEWGRAVVHYPLKRSGTSFAREKEADFAAGAMNDTYGFKPTDLVVGYDGSLFVSDWADGQRPKRGRGRIYRIRYVGKDEKQPVWPKLLSLGTRDAEIVSRLDSESYQVRCRAQSAIESRRATKSLNNELNKQNLGVLGRMHAIWVIAQEKDAIEKLIASGLSDPNARVQVQAVRAIADLADPVLVQHKLEATSGDHKLAARLAKWVVGKEPAVQLEVVIALGRLRWSGAVEWLRINLKNPDAPLAHAAQQAIRRCGDWKSVLIALDAPTTDDFRANARRAAAEQYDSLLVDGLIEQMKKDTTRQEEYVDLLARTHQKPGPWTYWGFRPGPRPANSVVWARTEAIEQALNETLTESKGPARLPILRHLLRENVPVRGKALSTWLKTENDSATLSVLLGALRSRPNEARAELEAVLQNRKHTAENRLLAATLFAEALDSGSESRLLATYEAVEDGPVLAVLLRAMGARKMKAATKPLLGKLSSSDALVRASAVSALAEIGANEAQEPIQKLFADKDAGVRTAAALAAGKMAISAASEALLKLTRDPEMSVRRASLESLRLLREPKALAISLAALADEELSEQALQCVAALGGPKNADAVSELAKRRPSASILEGVGKALAGWQADPAIEKAFSEIHGTTGVLLGWRVQGPLGDTNETLDRAVKGGSIADWRVVLSSGTDARVNLGTAKEVGIWLAACDLVVNEESKVEFFTTSSTSAVVRLNGKVVHKRDRPAVPGPYPERFEATLNKGTNRVLIQLSEVKDAGEFSLRFRRKSAVENHERLTRSSLSRAGNPGNGRKIFLDAEKSQCIKCHRVGDQGERIGPELTGLGSRFSKAHIIESILDPGRTVSPSFETVRVEMNNGKVLTGIKVAETELSVTIADNEAKKHVILRKDIDATKKQPGSAMPDGLEKRLTEDEFVDLVSFLVNLRQK